MVSSLIIDKDHYVQKGIGWTLRESIQVYPVEISKFIDKFLYDLSPIAFTTVCEKIPQDKTDKYKVLRKQNRINMRSEA